MEQHPVPQQISSYQFRLVGDMTLKQFFQVAGGVMVGLIFYSTTLPAAIKWPLILFAVLIGAALAFVPLEGRPLEKWIFAFFKSVYSPTIFHWKRAVSPRVFYKPETPTTPQQSAAPYPSQPIKEPKPTDTGLAYQGTPAITLEKTESSILAKISNLLHGSSQPTPITPPSPTPGKKGLNVPQTMPTAVAPQGFRPKMVVEVKPAVAPSGVQATGIETTKVAPSFSARVPSATQAVQYSQEAAPPLPPTQSNIIVGQVIDNGGKTVEGAILEIRDSAGRPVRAFKTNKVGHFLIVTPLINGVYELITEKEGLIFSHLRFEAKGEILPSIAIIAKAVQANTNKVYQAPN